MSAKCQKRTLVRRPKQCAFRNPGKSRFMRNCFASNGRQCASHPSDRVSKAEPLGDNSCPQARGRATCTIIGLPAPRVKSLAKPSLALVECLRMVRKGLTASWYAAGLHYPCRSTPSLKSRDPSPAPTYPYALRYAILYLWPLRG